MNALRALLSTDVHKANYFAATISGRARKIIASRTSPRAAVNFALDAVEAFEKAADAAFAAPPDAVAVASYAVEAALAARAAAAARSVGSSPETLRTASVATLLDDVAASGDRAAELFSDEVAAQKADLRRIFG